MKKLLCICLLTLATGAAFAQTGKMKDCIMMKDGKMMVMSKGMSMMMVNDTTFHNGTMVMKDGTVKMKDGTSVMLKEGQCVVAGKIQAMKMDKMQ
jgi:uncharacterized Zn ribbon protein